MAVLCILYFYRLFCLIKKPNVPKDAAWKALQFAQDSFFLHLHFFVFQNWQNSKRSDFDAAKKSFSIYDRCVFDLFITCYVLLKNKIYHKMQRERIYNLYKTAFLTVALVVFKSDQISTLQKRDFFLVHNEFVFLNFIFCRFWKQKSANVRKKTVLCKL